MKMLLLIIFASSLIGIAFFAVTKNNTQPDGLGLKDDRLVELPASPNAVSSQTVDAARKVEPLEFKGDLAESKQALRLVFSSMGAEIITETPVYLHAVFRTPIIPFRDDVELFFDARNRLIQYRSASRVGYSDFGVNRKRFETIRQLYYQTP